VDRGGREGRSDIVRNVLQKVALVLIWTLALSTVGLVVFLAWDVQVRRSVPAPEAVKLPTSRQPANPWARWTVTQSLSAHHVLIVHIETRYLDEALSIARQVADPIKFRYAEVLIYFHRPGRPDLLPPRRVQWTPDTDYVLANFEDDEH
jgi:hypothetical protein